DFFCHDCAIMARDTSSMVIPSFYTCDPEPQHNSKLVRPTFASGSQVHIPCESEIITNLFIGDLQDAARFNGMIISVLPDPMPGEPNRTIRMPFLANGRATLDSTAALIDAALLRGLR